MSPRDMSDNQLLRLSTEAKPSPRTLSTHRAMNIKTKSLLVSAVAAICIPAFADTCPSLGYEELQDMKVEELTQELCTAKKNSNENRSEAFNKTIDRYREDKAGAAAASAEADRCDNEQKRILRVLTKKNVEVEKIDYSAVCKAQAKTR